MDRSAYLVVAIIGTAAILLVTVCIHIFTLYVRGGQVMEQRAARATQMAPTRPVQAFQLAFQPDSFSGPNTKEGVLLVTIRVGFDVDAQLIFHTREVMNLVDPLPTGVEAGDPLRLIGGDSLQVPVRATINTLVLPGEYIVKAQAVRASDHSAILAEDTVKVGIAHEDGEPFFLTTSNAFSNYLEELSTHWHTLPESHYRVAVILDEGNYPQGGYLLIHAHGLADIPEPEIAMRVSSSSGIRFSQADIVRLNDNQTLAVVESGVIPVGGSRIYTVPFVVHPDSPQGRYALELHIQNGTEIKERLPVGIRLERSALNDPPQWLDVEPLN